MTRFVYHEINADRAISFEKSFQGNSRDKRQLCARWRTGSIFRIQRLDGALHGLKDIVGAVAERAVACMLAAAEIDGFGAFGPEHDRLEIRSPMRHVTERLPRRPSATAPGIDAALFQFNGIGVELRR